MENGDYTLDKAFTIISVAIPTPLWQLWQYCNSSFSEEELQLSISVMCQNAMESKIEDQWRNYGPYQIISVEKIDSRHSLYGVFYCEEDGVPRLYDGDKPDTPYNKRKKARKLNFEYNSNLYNRKMKNR